MEVYSYRNDPQYFTSLKSMGHDWCVPLRQNVKLLEQRGHTYSFRREIHDWLHANIIGHALHDNDILFFDKEADAISFKMRWG